MAATYVCAGDKLAAVDQHIPGEGTYVKDGFIHASLVGIQQIEPGNDASASGRQLIAVVSKSSVPIVPKIGDVVTCKVLRVQQNSTSCRIVCVGSKALDVEFRGSIRLQDVRLTEIDKIVMQDCFRPGDIVRAQVLSLGDARSYYLTTARNELGVVYARSVVAGVPMVAISWEEMQCPETQAIEKRKIARVGPS